MVGPNSLIPLFSYLLSLAWLVPFSSFSYSVILLSHFLICLLHPMLTIPSVSFIIYSRSLSAGHLFPLFFLSLIILTLSLPFCPFLLLIHVISRMAWSISFSVSSLLISSNICSLFLFYLFIFWNRLHKKKKKNVLLRYNNKNNEKNKYKSLKPL